MLSWWFGLTSKGELCMMYRLGALLAVALLSSASAALAQPYYPPPPPPPGYYSAPAPPPYPYGQYQQPQYTGQPVQYAAPPPAYSYGPPPQAPVQEQFVPAPLPAPLPPAAAPAVPPSTPAYTDSQNGVQQTGHKMTLEQIMAARRQNGAHGASTVIKVALGDKDNANFATVFPIIQGNMPHNISAVPDESIGSYQSATGVCLGLDGAALVQMDAAVVRAHKQDEDVPTADERGPQSCAAEMALVGPVYPDIGYLIVAADNRYSSMHKLLVDHSHPLSIAVGLNGSGGAITLQYLLNHHKNWHDSVGSVQHIVGNDALSAVENHQVDAYFVMEPENSHFINDIVNTFDGGGKFKLIGINPYDNFFDTKDGLGRPMYQAISLPGGHWYSSSTPTISVDTVLIMNKRFVAGNSDAARMFKDAVRNSIGAIKTATGTPSDWQPASRVQR
jgi:TRAP-type uncharacterized transport system substrate-binding protein